MKLMTPNLPLALPADSFENINEPFEGDLLERKPLAERLTGYLDRLRCGAALAIDAPWWVPGQFVVGKRPRRATWQIERRIDAWPAR